MLSRLSRVFVEAYRRSSVGARALFWFGSIFGFRIVESLTGWSISVGWESDAASFLAELLLTIGASFLVAAPILVVIARWEDR